MTAAIEYNGTTGAADAGYSSHVDNLNVFYDVRIPNPPPFSYCANMGRRAT